MNLDQKAQWHKDINGGLVPLLEIPDGTIIHESSFIMQFAQEYAKYGVGTKLLPNEGKVGDLGANIQTAQMKMAMEEFEKIFHASFWGAFMTRFSDEAKIKEAQDGLI
eukprot:CAMPEP_0168612368 /NCGR_PEP_ID=MMETSP0449_2-20121227/2880_1 /TAXON_ID=1082188 /ORGANISM="Strombidium rassoulzadegani, Strain ras09" /LENGTH=107 /DNA_ID=CAMNT_0008652929 /DNA_START=127 /DNA_END=450 /DNA_ORIENTATION=+